MQDIPKQFEKELLANKDIVLSDWVQEALDNAQELIVSSYEESLAYKLIEKSFQYAEKTKCPSGLVLAAAFDLFVGTQYYKSVAHKGWCYCPKDSPTLFFPFTNICPKCVLKGEFHFISANKLESGSIGKATSHHLCVFLNELFKRERRRLQIYKGSEPIDMLIYDSNKETILLAEIKAAPLTTLAIAVASDEITESTTGEDPTPITSHSNSDNPFLKSSELSLFLPIRKNENSSYRFVNLGIVDTSDKAWSYKHIEHVLEQDSNFFDDYLSFWIEAFTSYKAHYHATFSTREQLKNGNTFWLTNACGQPSPRPNDWPKRKVGTGYESVSDSKTSVGMDRTDDIKKGIYQVLKVGAESKHGNSRFTVKTALISNIHAVRHYDEYLRSLEDIVWLVDKSKKAKKVLDLPDDVNVYNLFDGIISFTESHIRDEWIAENFVF